MIQIVLNGLNVGSLTRENARVYLNQTNASVVSQTASTICVKG